MATHLTPTTPEALAAALRDASRDGTPVTPLGGGTHQHLGRAPLPEAITLSTAAINKILVYEPADLTITVQAGARLADVQAALAPHGQWLPWDAPAAAATLGGLLAAGVSGPLRLRHGTPRDWLLGATVALADGRIIKSGANVVKNVAGYDLHKLQIGALGTLGVLLSVTFKIAPVAPARTLIDIMCDDISSACALAELSRAAPLAPEQLVIEADDTGVRLWIGFAGEAAAVERQVTLVQHAAAAQGAQVALADDGTRVLAVPEDDVLPLIRFGTAPADLARACDLVARPGARLLALPGVGVGYLRLATLDAADLAAIRASLRTVAGYAVVERAPAALRATLDLYGSPPASIAVMRQLRAQWDPQSILNRGRFLV